MEKRIYKKLYAGLRDHTKPTLYKVVCGLSGYSTARELPVPPHGARAGIALRGIIKDYIIANPLGDESPHFLLGYFEGYITQVFKNFVQPNSITYDIGANIGYHSMQLSRIVGPGGRVFSFEPSPIEYDLLEWNVSVNKIRNIHINKLAVSNTLGVIEFALFNSPGVNHILRESTPDDAEVIEVSTVSLDDYVYKQGNPAPSLIKIDVEGSELSVLEGARDLLSKSRPIIVSEVWKSNQETIFGFMSENQYQIHPIHQDAWLSDVLFLPQK